MIRLSRTVRCTFDEADTAPTADAPRNGFGGVPAAQGLPRFYEFTVALSGEVNGRTGYLENIKSVDAAVLAAAPLVREACRAAPRRDAASLLPALLRAVQSRLAPRVDSIEWRVTPYHTVAMASVSPTTAILRQQFDFSAAHRLHVPSMSDEENRQVFGRCNHPSGHGHNYRVEPAVEVRLDAQPPFTAGDLERLTLDLIIRRFDHTHLNLDTAEFGPPPAGVNPTVENIARVCHGLLAPAVERDSRGGARLRSVTVWETDRTSATYPA
jgi:6-pyruvoyltetrahydropterin/6-carboxytetrahydropterin synthase